MTDIHVYEYDGGSMPGTVNGYYEIYLGEYGETFLASADNSNVFQLAKQYANEVPANIVFHTLAQYDAMSDLCDSMSLSTTKENYENL